MSRTKTRGGKNAVVAREERKTAALQKAAGAQKKPQQTPGSPNDTPKGKRKLEETESTPAQPARKRVDTRNKQFDRPEQTEYNKDIAGETPEQLAARFSTAIQKHKGELSTIELEDQSVPASAITNPIDFTLPRVVKNLCQFLEHVVPGGKQELGSCKDTSSPHTLLVTFSAIRTTDILRAIREYGSEENKIAKLFTKHMKLPALIEYVQATKFGLGAGTPKRICDLIEGEHMKINNLQRIVIDASYIDNKKNTIFRDHDGFLQTLTLLNTESLKPRFYSGATKIIFF